MVGGGGGVKWKWNDASRHADAFGSFLSFRGAEKWKERWTAVWRSAEAGGRGRHFEPRKSSSSGGVRCGAENFGGEILRSRSPGEVQLRFCFRSL